MFTTAGPTSLAIFVKSVERSLGEETFSGVASELSTFDSWPFTPCATTEPIRIPAERVARIVKVEARRRIRSRSSIEFISGLTSCLGWEPSFRNCHAHARKSNIQVYRGK